MSDFDVILVGGGLSNGLIALRLAAARPDVRILIIEAADRVGGNHTWCYHASDVTAGQDAWLRKLATATWPDQEVRFPALRRQLATGYRAIHSARLVDALAAIPQARIACSRRASSVSANEVVLDGGQRLSASCVIDGRGLSGPLGLALGHQKFLGLELELAEPHGLAGPIIMDASVAQMDGYRFLYCLPFTPTRLLVEDTYYSDTRALDLDAVAGRIHAYVEAAGWRIERHIRTESGNLPIVLDGSADAFKPTGPEPAACVGMRGGLFHQTTGYSLPLAAEVSEAISALPGLTTKDVAELTRSTAETAWQRQSFFRLLNRLLFVSARAHERVAVMQRFYGLSHGLIERFYAGRLTAADKARILTGRPPIPLIRALKAIRPQSAHDRISFPPPKEPREASGSEHG